MVCALLLALFLNVCLVVLCDLPARARSDTSHMPLRAEELQWQKAAMYRQMQEIKQHKRKFVIQVDQEWCDKRSFKLWELLGNMIESESHAYTPSRNRMKLMIP
jgi:hypothetical protein